MGNENELSTFDVIVLGAGGSGLVAGLSAAESGSEVLILERTEVYGGHTLETQGMFPVANSRFQLQQGFDFPPEQIFNDIMRMNHGEANPELVMELCKQSGNVADWFADYVGLQLIPVTEFKYYGYTSFSIVSPTSRSGSDLVTAMRKKAENTPNLTIVTGRRAKLKKDTVSGSLSVVIEGTDELLKSKKFVVATGGFGANKRLLSRYIPDAVNLKYFGSTFHDGTAVSIAKDLGLQLSNMDSYQAHSSLSAVGTLISWESVMKGSIIINSQGSRFAEEKIGYSEFASKLSSQEGSFGFELIPDGIYSEMYDLYSDFRLTESVGGFRHCHSIDELADYTGANKEKLQTSVGFLTTSILQKSSRETRIFPLHCAKIFPALFHTLGGIRTDRFMRAIEVGDRTSDTVYAVGDAAAGISGRGSTGYLSGSGLLMAIVGGYIAGKHATGKLQ